MGKSRRPLVLGCRSSWRPSAARSASSAKRSRRDARRAPAWGHLHPRTRGERARGEGRRPAHVQLRGGSPISRRSQPRWRAVLIGCQVPARDPPHRSRSDSRPEQRAAQRGPPRANQHEHAHTPEAHCAGFRVVACRCFVAISAVCLSGSASSAEVTSRLSPLGILVRTVPSERRIS